MGLRGPTSEKVLFVSEHFLAHPKIQALTDAEFRFWIGMLLEHLRSANGSELPNWNYGITQKRRIRFIELGLLDEIDGSLHIHGWDQWNGREAYKRFLNRERVRRHRERSRHEM